MRAFSTQDPLSVSLHDRLRRWIAYDVHVLPDNMKLIQHNIVHMLLVSIPHAKLKASSLKSWNEAPLAVFPSPPS
jgi:hypothetical protein